MKDWKEDIDKKYGITSSVDPDYRFLKAERIGTLIADIGDLLKKQREKYYYEIENSTGTKEADYIDKQVNGGSE